jgi:hypothetical protein
MSGLRKKLRVFLASLTGLGTVITVVSGALTIYYQLRPVGGTVMIFVTTIYRTLTGTVSGTGSATLSITSTTSSIISTGAAPPYGSVSLIIFAAALVVTAISGVSWMQRRRSL